MASSKTRSRPPRPLKRCAAGQAIFAPAAPRRCGQHLCRHDPATPTTITRVAQEETHGTTKRGTPLPHTHATPRHGNTRTDSLQRALVVVPQLHQLIRARRHEVLAVGLDAQRPNVVCGRVHDADRVAVGRVPVGDLRRTNPHHRKQMSHSSHH